MRSNRIESGLTLIEILIALVVLVTGLVGVLALFPAAIRSTNKSVEDRMAATVAESVAHALVVAMRSATPESAILYHDGLPESGCPFNLPQEVSSILVDYPAQGVFMLGLDPDLKEVFDDVISGPDKTDPYTQYGFTFKVGRVDNDMRLYEFRIAVYRNPSGYSGGGGGSGVITDPKPLKVFVIQLSGL